MLMHHFAAVDEAVAQSILPESHPDALETPLEAARRFLELSREDRVVNAAADDSGAVSLSST